MCIGINKIYVGIVTGRFEHIYDRVMAFDCQNFVSVQYLENKLTEIHQNFIYALKLTRSRLGLLPVIILQFCKRVMALLDVRFSFPLISSEKN